MQIGDLYISNGQAVNVVDIQGEYTLLEFSDKNIPAPYVWALKAVPKDISDGKLREISWAAGHYYSTPEAAAEQKFKRIYSIRNKQIEIYYRIL